MWGCPAWVAGSWPRRRALRPQLKLLFITGYASEAIFDIDAMPGTELLNKPFSMAELAARLAHLTHDS